MRGPRKTIIAVVTSAFALLGICTANLHAQTTKPAYPDTVDGLTRFFKDTLAAADAKDEARVLAMSQSLVLPKPLEWFTEVFGTKVGTKLAEDYQRDMKNLHLTLAILFLRLKNPTELTISINKVESLDDPDIEIYQILAIQAMRNPTALYKVMIGKDGTTDTIGLWSLVYENGQFRFAGKMTGIREATR